MKAYYKDTYENAEAFIKRKKKKKQEAEEEDEE
jgi:hypothetical protein